MTDPLKERSPCDAFFEVLRTRYGRLPTSTSKVQVPVGRRLREFHQVESPFSKRLVGEAGLQRKATTYGRWSVRLPFEKKV